MISSINCNGVKTHHFEILEINGLSWWPSTENDCLWNKSKVGWLSSQMTRTPDIFVTYLTSTKDFFYKKSQGFFLLNAFSVFLSIVARRYDKHDSCLAIPNFLEILMIQILYSLPKVSKQVLKKTPEFHPHGQSRSGTKIGLNGPLDFSFLRFFLGCKGRYPRRHGHEASWHVCGAPPWVGSKPRGWVATSGKRAVMTTKKNPNESCYYW